MNPLIGSRASTAKPSSVICSDYNVFSSMCHAMDEPILITRNGESDLVVMSHKTYNGMIVRMKLMAELMEADRDLKMQRLLLGLVKESKIVNTKHR